MRFERCLNTVQILLELGMGDSHPVGKLYCGSSSKVKLTRRIWPSCYPKLPFDPPWPPTTLARVRTSALQADDQPSGKGSETHLALQVTLGFLLAFLDLRLDRFDLLGLSVYQQLMKLITYRSCISTFSFSIASSLSSCSFALSASCFSRSIILA
jgi:hypothetical protein